MTVDYKEIAKAWDEQKPSGRSGGKSFWFAIRTAIEKQIPKKPYSDQKGLLDAKMWHCPVCKKEVISDWNRDLANDYCHNCGQALDWQ